jgi:hypothetical protein
LISKVEQCRVFLEWEKIYNTILEKVFFIFNGFFLIQYIPQVFLEWEKISNTILGKVFFYF